MNIDKPNNFVSSQKIEGINEVYFKGMRLPATKSLFKQYNPAGKEDIEEWRKKFVSAMDIHEYYGAKALEFSWKEWCKFKEYWPSFEKLHLRDWIAEIEVIMKAEAVQTLIEKATGSGKDAAMAAKFLAEGKYKDKPRGKPSKDQIQERINFEAKQDKEVANDSLRVKGNV